MIVKHTKIEKRDMKHHVDKKIKEVDNYQELEKLLVNKKWKGLVYLVNSTYFPESKTSLQKGMYLFEEVKE